MGGSKETVKSETKTETRTESAGSSTTQFTPSPEETRLNQLEIERIEATQPGLIDVQKQGLDLIRLLLSGSTALPGFFKELEQGISPETVSGISREAVADIAPSFQSSGLLDSGVRAAVSGQVAGDVRRSAQEFNIGNRLNLLNLALSGQAQVQAPVLSQAANVGARLAGLRSGSSSFQQSGSGTSTGSGTQTTIGPNPFLQSFQTSFGSALGSKFGSPNVPGFG